MKVRGDASAYLFQRQIDALDRAFATADYFSLADKYDGFGISDEPSATTSYRSGGRSKTIEHYLGDRSAPEALSELENAIDHIVEIERWIGTQRDRKGHREDWY